jgi:hypothetical protein
MQQQQQQQEGGKLHRLFDFPEPFLPLKLTPPPMSLNGADTRRPPNPPARGK